MSENSYRSIIGKSIERAVSILQSGGIVAFPTETYYGLAVDTECVSAVKRLFTVKQRPENKPLLLLIEKYSQLETVVRAVPDEYRPLMAKYWPGPLTLIFPARSSLDDLITGATGTVGVRISPNPIAEKLVQYMGKPITATSANVSGCPPALSAQEVLKIFGEKIDYILDGGMTKAGLCSTIIGLQHGKLKLVRHGQVELSEELGTLT